MRIRYSLKNVVRAFSLLLILGMMFMVAAIAEDTADADMPDEDKLASKVSAVLEYLNLSGKNDYAIIFDVYNYICQTVEYDWAATDNFPWDGVSLGCGQTAYEALCQEQAVCAGIARAITLLLEEAGISCRTVIGYTPFGIGHAWNLVQLNNQWYFMDATNDLGLMTYTKFLKNWDDFGNYVVLSDSNFDIADYNLAKDSYVGNIEAFMDSYGDYKFNVGFGNITLFSYCGTEKDLVIPSEINGRKVKRLASNFIMQNEYLETLVISEGIERINSLFVGCCSNLKSISIPSTAYLNLAASSMFVTGTDSIVQSCTALESITVADGNPYLCVVDGVLYNKEKTDLILYPPQKKDSVHTVMDGIQTIMSAAFEDNIYIQEVILPNSVVTIGYWSFLGCSSLEKINIPNSCTRIGQFAFDDTKLTDIHIPAATTEIIYNVFPATLQTITVDENNPNYYAVDNVLFSYSGVLKCYAAQKKDTEYTIPTGITDMDPSAFAEAHNLQRISFPTGFLYVGYSAFMNCTALVEVTLPDTLLYIDNAAFAGCRKLAKLVIPSSVEMIEGDPLLGDRSVVIYGEMGSTAQIWADNHGYLFVDIDSIEAVQGVCGEHITWSLSETGVLTITGTGEMDTTDEVPWAPYGHLINTAIVSEGITSVGANAFSSCKALTSVLIPDSVTQIEEFAFLGCSALQNIKFPESVTTIQQAVLYDCASLESFEIPSQISDIPSLMFYQCSSLQTVDIPESVTTIGEDAFYGCSSLTSVTLPKNLRNIDSGAFQECLMLNNVILPEGLVYIGRSAFYRCTSLTSITIPSGITAIYDYTFFLCSSLAEVNIPEGVEYIGTQAFLRCVSLTELLLPESIATIGESAFDGCYSLDTVIIHSKKMPTIHNLAFGGISPNIYCYIGSEIEAWAQEQGYQVSPLDLLDFSLPEDCILLLGTLIDTGTALSPEAEKYLSRQSSDETVVTVRNHLLTAVGTGTATITVRYCGEVLDEMSIVVTDGKDPHAWEKRAMVELPSCTKDGMQNYICKDCGLTKVEIVVAHHQWDNGVYVVQQTCTDVGSKEYTCIACGLTQMKDIAPHFWSNGMISVTPTTDKAGEMTYTCQQCGGTKTAHISFGIAGDVNEGKFVDMLDIIDLMEWYCGGVIELNLANGEVTGDGVVDMLDIIALMEWYCGAEVTLCGYAEEVVE